MHSSVSFIQCPEPSASPLRGIPAEVTHHGLNSLLPLSDSGCSVTYESTLRTSSPITRMSELVGCNKENDRTRIDSSVVFVGWDLVVTGVAVLGELKLFSVRDMRSRLELFVIVIHFVEYLAHYLLKCFRSRPRVRDVKDWYSEQGYRAPDRNIMVMAAPVISISSNLSVESVGSSFLLVILIGSISVEVSVAPEVGSTAVASPAGVPELDTHSSSKADPSESSLPLVSVAPMVLPFLCQTIQSQILRCPRGMCHLHLMILCLLAPIHQFTLTNIILPVDAPPKIRGRQAILIRPREDIPIGRLYRTHHGRSCRALTVRKSVRPLPSHCFALRGTQSHTLDRFTSGYHQINFIISAFTLDHSSSDHPS
ncbi:hypothetical protein Tco_0235724 [Tanacetum coccineum]